MAQNYTEQLRKDNVRDAIYEDLQNNCEVLRTSWSGNAFPANPKVGQPCYRVDEDKLYYWDGYKWSQKGGGGSAELKTMELAAATSERVSITLEGARCLDKNMMFVFVDKIAQDPSTYSMNDDGTVVNFNPAIPANAAVTLRWFDTDVGTFDTAIFASDAEFAAGELTNKAPNVKQVHSLSDQIQTSNANYVKSELQSNLLNYTTNRILEIPQDIKLELNNGTLTLKAGSKVYVPNGAGTFNAVTIASDVSTQRQDNQDCIAWYNTDTGTIQLFPSILFYSGTTAPSGYQFMFWYDTTSNKCKATTDSGSTWVEGKSFPICVVSTDGTKISAIKQVFNGFGYIGSTVFALPGVKVQSSTGRNADGTCTNLVHTVSSVFTYEAGPWNNATLYFLLWYNSCEGQDVRRFTRNKEFSSQAVTYSFDENENKWYFSNNSQTWNDSGLVLNIVGKFVVASGKITSFEPYTVDSVLNSSLSNLSAAGQAKFDAKANVDLGNLSTAGQAILNGKADINASNFTATGKETVVGWMGINTSSSIERALNTEYTATRNCWIYHDENGNNNSSFYVNGVVVYRTICHAGVTNAKGSALVFVEKGQKWKAENGVSVKEFGTLGG